MCYNDMRSGKTDAVQNKTLYSFMHSWHDPIACQPRAQPAEGTPSGVSADAEGHTAPAAFTAGIQLHTMHSWRNPIACQPRAQPAEGTPSGVSADAEGHTAPAAFTAGIQLHTMHSWRNWIACQPPTLKVVGSIPAQYPKYTRNAGLENIGKCRIIKVLQGIKKR